MQGGLGLGLGLGLDPNPSPNPNPNPNPHQAWGARGQGRTAADLWTSAGRVAAARGGSVRTTAETAAAARSADRARRRAARSGEGKEEEEENEEAPSLRVWSCGCSSGEELFSARMVYEAWVAPSFEVRLRVRVAVRV